MRIALAAALILLAPSAHAEGGDGSEDILALTSITATSTLPNKNDRWAARRAIDSSDDTFWCEGKPDEGVGEALTLSFALPTTVDSLSLELGVWKSDKLFAANNIPTKLEIAADDGRTFPVTAPAEKKTVKVGIGGKPVKSLALRIGGVQKGTMNDTCVSEISISAGGTSRIPVAGIPASARSGLHVAVAAAAHALADCNGAGLGYPVTYEHSVHHGHADDTQTTATWKDAAAFAAECKKAAPFGVQPVADEDPIEVTGPGADPGEVVVEQNEAQVDAELTFRWSTDRWKLVRLSVQESWMDGN